MLDTLLLLAALQAGPSPTAADWPRPEVHADRGPWVARIEKLPGQERVRDPLARWQLTVADEAQGGDLTGPWSLTFPHADVERRYHLTDDGSIFVEINVEASSRHPAVRLWTAQGELGRLDPARLGVPRKALELSAAGHRWLADVPEPTRLAWRATDRGPVLLLLTQGRDGEERAVDVGYALPLEEATAMLRARLAVTPRPDEQLLESAVVPTVLGTRFPTLLRQGETLRFEFDGSHPTPGHRFDGFLPAWQPSAPNLCVLQPFSRRPLPGRTFPQRLETFSAQGELSGLPPGRYQFLVLGTGDQDMVPSTVEVLPPDQLVRLRRIGGRDALDETRTLFARGVLEIQRGEAPPELLAVGPRPAARVRALAPRLFGRGERLLPGPGSAEEPRLEFTWWPPPEAGGTESERRAVFEGGRAPATVIELVALLCPPETVADTDE